MKHPNIQHLYKYREPTARNLQMLTNNQVFFAAPVTFNDPFDCAIEPIINDVKSGEEVFELTVQRFVKYHGTTEEETREKLASFRKANPQQLKQICEMIRRNEMEGRINNLGVLSLSEIDNHPLMWAHYADSHKGFCIEYQRTHTNELGLAQPITYSKNYPKVSLFKMDMMEQSELSVFTKSMHWSYEKEWRRVIHDPNVIHTHDVSYITGIIFGAKTESKFKGEVARALEGRKNVRYYQARLKERSYDMYIEAL